MTIDKFGRHINQKNESLEEQRDLFQIFTTNIVENKVREMYYNIILTFESTTFQENSKEYLISNVKTCHTFFYEFATIEYVVGYPADIVTNINKKEFSMEELVNLQLKRGDNISFRERNEESTNSSLFLEFFIRVPIGF